jgi:hypothetical protein
MPCGVVAGIRGAPAPPAQPGTRARPIPAGCAGHAAGRRSAIVAYVAVVIAWFAIVITGRYPAGLYGVAAGYLRFSTRAVAYMMLAVDAYPPFSVDEAVDYPVRVHIPAPRSATAGSRRCFGSSTSFRRT